MKSSISKKLLLGLTVFTLFVAMCISIVSILFFRNRTIEKYEYVGTAITGSIAEKLNGDKAINYLKPGCEPDAYYAMILRELNSVKDNFDLLYVYIAVPEENCVRYIWCNGFTAEEAIGDTSEYAAGGKEWMKGKLEGTETSELCFAHDPKFGFVATAASPVYNGSKQPVALVLVDFSVQEINDAVKQIALMATVDVLLILAIYLLIHYKYVQKQIVVPVEKLTKAARDLTENLDKDYTYKSDIHTGDELEELSKAFEKMDVELRDYINTNMKITAEKERIGAELDMAAAIQKSQLPGTFPAFPDRKDFDIYASMTPAKTVGGDFYDFFMLDDDHIALVMADVSGKGVPASLFMMIAKLLIMNCVKQGDSPAQALTHVNDQLTENNTVRQFVTVWLAVIDLKTGKGIAANAGHEHPSIKRAGESYELIKYRHSPPVATLPGLKFKDHEFELHPGDSLFVYTDGVTEATDLSDVLFGEERLLKSLNKDADASPEDVLKNVMDGITEFCGGAEQFDDITMLCFKYFGQEDRN